MEKKKFKSEKEIIKLTMLERALRTEEIDKRYQGTLRMVHDKNEKYLNYNPNPMINFDTKNLITCYNNQMIDIEEFINRMEKIVGYRIMFDQMTIEDEK